MRLPFASAVVAAVVLALPAAAAAAEGALAPTDVPGLAPTALRDAAVRAELAGPLPRAIRATARRAVVDGSAFRGGGVRLLNGSVAFARAADARALLAAWRRTRPRPAALALGDGALVQVRSARDVHVVVRVGATVGVIRLRGPRARAGAVAYARTLVSRLRTAAAETPLDRLEAGGVTRAEALQRFALVLGPLPGVRMPRGVQPLVLSGTDIAADVLDRLAELTPAQRAAVARALDLGLPGAPSARVASLRETDPELARRANGVAALYGGFMGHALGLTIDIGWVDAIDKAYADASPVDALGLFDPTDPSHCRVRVSRAAIDREPATLAHAIAHEVFHCFEYDLNPGGYRGLGNWIIEGLAEWAAATVNPEGSDVFRHKFGVRYFGLPETPLFQRAYDAAFFWGRLQEQTGSLWGRVPAIVRSTGGDSAIQAAGATAPALLDAWAPSFLRRDRPSGAWTTARPWAVGAGEVASPLGTVTATTTLRATPWTVQLYAVQPDPERPLVSLRVGAGHVRLTDRTALDRVLLGGDEVRYCLPSGCACPPGEHLTIPAPEEVAALDAAVGASFAGAELSVRYGAMRDVCEPDDELDFGDGGQTNGDPHLTSFDGLHFDFQAAGEFVLARHGAFEVQVRQEPWQGSRHATVNTAVAMRVGGTRVTFAPGQPPEVAVAGRELELAPGAEAPAGRGSIARSADGNELAVRWPDGSAARVRTIGSYGLVLDLLPAAVHRGRLVGLLGDGDGDPGDDLVGRGGGRVAYRAVSAGSGVAGWQRPQQEGRPSFFRALYRTWGESWRVTPAESLFAYAPGQSTATFTDRTIPSAPLTLDDFPAAARARAEERCRAAGVGDPAVLEDCVLDILVTGEDLFAEAAAQVEMAARASAWLPLPDVADRTSPLSLARTADGVLHAVFARPAGLIDVPVTAGAPGPAVAIGAGAGEPVAVARPDGTLRVLAGTEGGVLAFASQPPWQAWAPLPPLTALGTRGRVAAVAVADGSLLAAVPDASRLRVVREGVADPVDPAADAPQCATGFAALARDGAGGAWLAWMQSSCDTAGIRVAQLDGAGAVRAAPIAAPGSAGHSTNGSTGVALAVAGEAAYVAYSEDLGGGSHRVLLWPVGGAPVEVVRLSFAPRSIALAAEPGTRRLWVAWEDGFRERLWVRRTARGGAALDGPQRVFDAPPDRPAIVDHTRWSIDARDGALDVLYGARSPQDGPAGAAFVATIDG